MSLEQPSGVRRLVFFTSQLRPLQLRSLHVELQRILLTTSQPTVQRLRLSSRLLRRLHTRLPCTTPRSPQSVRQQLTQLTSPPYTMQKLLPRPVLLRSRCTISLQLILCVPRVSVLLHTQHMRLLQTLPPQPRLGMLLPGPLMTPLRTTLPQLQSLELLLTRLVRLRRMMQPSLPSLVQSRVCSMQLYLTTLR